jgi:methylglutaconyl-CoA hydratase
MNSPLVIRSEPKPGVVVLTLNRADKRNALTIGLMEALAEAVEIAGREVDNRVLILRGEGKAFCAGLDLAEATQPDVSHRSAELVARMLRSISQSPLATIAAVHGAAVAGGAGIMSACDLVVADEATRIGYPEVRRGLVAGMVMIFLRRQVRERDAQRLLLLGELIDAREAKAMGLVTETVAGRLPIERALEMADEILLGAPGAIRRTKQWLDELWPREMENDFERALAHHLAARDSVEAKEGMKAFVEKRPPAWQMM